MTFYMRAAVGNPDRPIRLIVSCIMQPECEADAIDATTYLFCYGSISSWQVSTWTRLYPSVQKSIRDRGER